jgi:hypothetical protein
VNTVSQYDPQWVEAFDGLRRPLDEQLDRIRVYHDIRHVGSTSVPGLAAKPIIDILVGVSEERLSDPAVIDVILANGYHEVGVTSPFPRRIFTLRGRVTMRANLHLVPLGGRRAARCRCAPRLWSALTRAPTTATIAPAPEAATTTTTTIARHLATARRPAVATDAYAVDPSSPPGTVQNPYVAPGVTVTQDPASGTWAYTPTPPYQSVGLYVEDAGIYWVLPELEPAGTP